MDRSIPEKKENQQSPAEDQPTREHRVESDSELYGENSSVDLRNPVEVLAEEYADRLRSGETPSIAEYVDRYPEHRKEIELIFPSIAAVEQIGSDEARKIENDRASRQFTESRLNELGDFEVVRELGRGGMGIVYEVIQKSLNRRVALKTVHPSISDSPKQLLRFQREAKAAARLQHTHIIQVYGVGQSDGIHFYVMQLINGHSLSEWIQSIDFQDSTVSLPAADKSESTSGKKDFESTDEVDSNHSIELATEKMPYPVFLKRVAQMMSDAADAIGYAHDNGVFHRDIKPANLMLDPKNGIQIGDFGLAKFSEQDALTNANDVVGTLRYMAPEQFLGKIDQRTDIYSLGLTLFELITRQPAFGQQSKNVENAIRDRQSTVPRLRSIDPRIPVDLDTIVAVATATDPNHRFQHANELRDELRRFVDGRPILSRPVGWTENLWRWAKRNPAIASLASVASLLLMTVAIVAMVGNWQTRQAMQGMKQEFERAESETIRAEKNLNIAKSAIAQILENLSQRGTPKEKSFQFDDEEFIGTTANLSQADIDMLHVLLSGFTQFAEANSDDLSLETAEAQSTIGNIYQRLGRYQEAATAYRAAFDQMNSIVDQRKDEGLMLQCLKALNGVVVCSSLAGDRSGSEAAFVLAKKFHTSHAKYFDNEAGKFEFAQTMSFYANTYRRINPVMFLDFGPRRPPKFRGPPPQDRNGRGFGRGPRGGRKSFGKGRKGPKKQEGPSKERPNGQYKNRPGSFGGRKGRSPNPTPADRYLLASAKAESILEELIESDPENIKYRLTLAKTLSYRLRILKGKRSVDEFEKTLDRVKTILEGQIAKNPDSAQLKSELIEILTNNVFENSSRSREQIDTAIEMAAKLTANHPRVIEYRALHADALAKEASLNARFRGQAESANDGYLRAIEAYQEIIRSQPDAYQFQLAQVQHLMAYANLLDRQKKQEEARSARIEARDILQGLELPQNENSPAKRIEKALVYAIEGSRQP